MILPHFSFQACLVNVGYIATHIFTLKSWEENYRNYCIDKALWYIINFSESTNGSSNLNDQHNGFVYIIVTLGKKITFIQKGIAITFVYTM